jgi:hypothetical protein
LATGEILSSASKIRQTTSTFGRSASAFGSTCDGTSAFYCTENLWGSGGYCCTYTNGHVITP